MKYLMSVIDDESTGYDEDGSGAVEAFNERIGAEGYLVFVGGLDSPATATVVDNRGDAAIFTDGPYLESKEHLGGLWIIEAQDLDVVLKLAAEASLVCNRKLEVRPFADE
ncbi:YciI family protein [Kribbella sp. NPDC058693]|uniref:YciI family protein n=1 Tax=Kribbella sp. NPDC058693 TaxID=3346602 RepID=UPI003663E818